MRNLALATLAVAATLAQPMLAQRVETQPLPDTTPLAITILPAPVSKGQMPKFVTITLTNTSDQAVRFPKPQIGCQNPAAGSVELVVTPSKEGTERCSSFDLSVPARKSWTVLKPGETANYGQMVTPLLPEGPGTFEVRGVYTAPHFDGAIAEELYRDGIAYPKDTLTSSPALIIREAAE